ncbi:MAG: FHA domain-containing protein [Bacteriovoracia bacterium]
MKVTVLKSNKPISEASWPDSEVEEGFEAFIGRSEDCHVLIDDPLISRHHLVLRFEDGRWRLEKLSQLGSVTVSGKILEKIIDVSVGESIIFPPYAIRLDELPGVRPSTVSAPSASPMPTTTVEFPSDLMSDDLPPLESVDATVFIPPPQTVTVATPVSEPQAEELGQGLEDLPGGDFLSEDIGDLSSSPSFDETTQDSSMDDPDDSGEAIPEESTDADFGSFSDDSATSSELMTNEVAPLDDGSDSTRVLQKFASYELLLFGEFAPYDRYSIDKAEIFIGRDTKKCQIVLTDSEVSSVHAVLRKNMISLTLEDLNSSNGTLLNGQRINKADLTNGDEFIIGSTTFTVQVVSDLLEAESDRLMPVETGQTIEQVEEIEEEVDLGDAAGSGDALDFSGANEEPEKSVFKRFLKRYKTDPQFKKKVIIGVVLAMLLLSLYDTTPDPSSAPKKEVPKAADAAKVEKATPAARVLSPEQIRSLEAKYKIAEAYVNEKKLDEALAELEQILAIDPDYANAKTLFQYVQEKSRKLKEEQERLKQEEIRAKIREEVKAMLVEAKEAVAQRNIPRSEQLFSKILEKDPENIDVTPLRLELEAWQAEERAKKEAEERKRAERARQVDALAPGKKLYLSKEWYKAILKLEEFITMKNLDEDLIKDASDMLADAKSQLASDVAPILGRARSLKEGQDLKGAYEAYLEVLSIEPTNKEGLDEVDAIREILDTRSKKVYREAIIAESLSLFSDAKEKFQEVQQISPTDSEYYKKATDKLKNYLE